MRFIFCIILSVIFVAAKGQLLPPTVNKDRRPGNNRNVNATMKTGRDTTGFQQRNNLEDSITISFHYLDSTTRRFLDSSVTNFDNYFPLPRTWQNLGNNGAAAYPILFEPIMKAGFDAGFHAYDVYKFKLEETKLYRTTRPFSMLGYQLAGGKEQMLQASHTQNPKPNFNFGFDYRLISAPGLFINQNTNHNSYRIFSTYTGKRKRYNANLIFLGNNIRASQNGGIQNDTLLSDPNRKDRFSVPVNLGNNNRYNTNPFVTTVNTGITYRDLNLFLRQSYDLGKKDSIKINDTLTDFLFYPKLRLQHTFKLSIEKYSYLDKNADSAVYKDWYDKDLISDTLSLKEKYRIISNDISFLSFPDTKNQSQFFLAGAEIQNIKASNSVLYNVKAHAEYRNKTRNKLWDILIAGEIYTVGYNKGNYSAQAFLSRYLNKKLGNVSVLFKNVNRTPSYIFNNNSKFNLSGENFSANENIILLSAKSENSFATISFENYLLNNYTYFYDYYHARQFSSPINILRVSASKKINISKHIKWYTENSFQQSTKNSPVHLPLLYSFNRFAFEGSFFKNLSISTGFELRYISPYKANNYSPVTGSFFSQDTIKINNRPDINFYLHFRIRSFTGYIRLENLNTVSTENGFGFTHNNFAAPHYPTPGLLIRFGIRWWFVN